MTVGSDQGRGARTARPELPGGTASLVDLYDDALPIVHRYLFASTGGDADLAEELTAATFEVAAAAVADGRGGPPALGTLLDTARSVLTARVSPVDPGVRRPRGTTAHPEPSEAGPGPAPAAGLRRLPLGQRVALALRYHDHLPVDEIGRVLGIGPDAVEALLADAVVAAGVTDTGESGGPADAAAAERLRAAYASLTAPADPTFAADLRGRLAASLAPRDRAAGDAVETAGDHGRPRPDPVAPAPAHDAVSSSDAVSSPDDTATPVSTAAPISTGSGSDLTTPPAAAPPVPHLAEAASARADARASARRRDHVRSRRRSGITVSRPPDAGADPRDPVDAPAPLEVVTADDLPTGIRPTRADAGDDRLLSRPAGGRLRQERGVRTWLGVAAVAVLAIVGLAVAGGGGDDGGDPATPSGGGVAGSDAAAGQSGTPGTVPLRVIPPAEYVGTVVPEVTADAEVVTRIHLGPGGPYMNGPYAIASGDEGLWATAVGDDGTWQAVRVDAATGERLAAVRIPGRVPSDTSHHGLALSGGYVWAPALRDGLFRIDASTNAPSGIVGVSGGVVGAALDGGDGAVWAVGHDSVVRRIDARTTEVTAAAMIPELGLMPDGVDLAYGGGTVWVTVGENAERFLIGFDPVTLDRRATYRVQPVGLVGDVDDLAADGDRVVITEAPPGGVTVIDGAEGRVLASHEMATAGIAIDGDRAWIMSPAEGRATVVWTRTGELLASTGVPVGVSDIVPTLDGGVWAAVPSTGDLVRLRFGG